jgi:glucokinase
MEKLYLAADLGGTNLRMAAVSRGGDILFRDKVSTPSGQGKDAVVDTILSVVANITEQIDGRFELAAFGAAVPAVVNSREGLILRSPNLSDLNGIQFSELFSQKLDMPVVLENDANSAAIGESWKGASIGVKNSIQVTLGTGVGGGIIIDGKVLRGVDGTAGEIGHIAVVPDGYPCGCGSVGCVEQYASATAIVRIARELMPDHPDSVLHSQIEMTPLDVYEAGIRGDNLSIEVFRLMGRHLGVALGALVNVLNPEAIVIGGGASAGWDLFIGHLRSEIDSRAFQHPAERVKLLRSTLGDDAGILGAAYLASEAVK